MKEKLNKKGVSGIIGTIILIALVIFTAGIVWVVVNNIIGGGIDEASSCFGIFDKVKLDPEWTCYNYTSNETLFKIDIGDINVNEVLVGITAQGTSTSFRILKTESQITGVSMYPDRNPNVKLPDKGGGFTYIINMIQMGFGEEMPSIIQIAPIIGEQTCEISSTVDYIETCR
ncbi:hypothetical protein FJZ20_01480 [Candidatus Pacearchaeota archaeon]|nr:hypothetical protein [Candidatus Pacearchaeota archaeon]